MLYYEFRKNFLTRRRLILLAVCLLLNWAGIYYSCAFFRGRGNGLPALLNYVDENLRGELTLEKVNLVIDETQRLEALTQDMTASRAYNPDTLTGNIISDAFMFQFDIYPAIRYAYSYYYFAENLVARAAGNVRFYDALGNLADRRLNEKIVRDFQGRKIDQFHLMFGARMFALYDFSAYLFALFCVFVISPVLSGEKEAEMTSLLMTTRRARRNLLPKKILYCLSATGLLSLLFTLSDVAGFLLFSPIDGFFDPIYAIELFEKTPLTCSIAGYIAITFLCRTLALWTIAAFLLLISTWIDKTMIIFLAAAAIVSGIYFIPAPNLDIIAPIDLLHAGLLLKSRYLFAPYANLNLFGYPVSAYIVVICVQLVSQLVFIRLAFFRFAKIYRVGTGRSGKEEK